MFPRRYFNGRMFAPRYFPQSQGGAPEVIVTDPGGVWPADDGGGTVWPAG